MLLLLVAAMIRLLGINSQLWLDEIWSIRLAQLCRTPLGVFAIHHDNNHWLNTLVLYFLGPGRPFWQYHVLPEICGIGTVLLGWLLARRSIAALILLGLSEFLVEFSTDARGYAPASFFALACLLLLRRHLAKPARWSAAAMSASAVLGLLSHLTFVVVLAGLAATSAISLLRQRRTRTYAIAHTLVWWSIPVLVLAALYIFEVRPMIRGGGPLTPKDLPSQAAAMILGIPVGSPAAAVCGIIASFLWAIQTWRLYRAGDMLWPVMATAIVFVAAVLFLWPRSDYLHPRYVYLAVPLIFAAIGMELDRWIDNSKIGRAAAIVILAAFCAANAFPLARFIRLGRGDYLGAVTYVVEHTAGEDVVVTTADHHPLSTLMVVGYYEQYYVPSSWAHRPMTLPDAPWGDQWSQWMISEIDYGPASVAANGVRFIRRGIYPSGGVASGIAWAVYESESQTANVRPGNLESILPE